MAAPALDLAAILLVPSSMHPEADHRSGRRTAASVPYSLARYGVRGHMNLREVRIQNFRNLADVTIPIDDVTLLVGENNSGKTALLDALKIALPKTSGGKLSPFDEYDYHMVDPKDSPETSKGILIELWFREDLPDQWPKPLIQALSEIAQLDPIANINSIGLRITSKFDQVSKAVVFRREFLAQDGQPLTGKAAAPAILTRFLEYVRFFYLSALRDSAAEFSSKSQFWGRILRDLKIDEAKRQALQLELSKLNAELLAADPRLKDVCTALENLQKVVAAGDSTSIQPLPLQPWDLMARSEVVIRGRANPVHFPLARHGQGMQSLSVLFLFQAYIDVLLKPSFHAETAALLALEEPETHLHPHATRSLAATLGKIKSQKIISTHSPYFLQEVPFGAIRLLRRVGPTTQITYVRREASAILPSAANLASTANKYGTCLHYDAVKGRLSTTAKLEESCYRELLALYPGDKATHAALAALRIESQLILTSGELADLETFAKRIRGELLFARAWLLCEGQTEYLLFRYFAELLSAPLDQHGVTVIDFQNNGSAEVFVALARNFGVPWVLICDSDSAGVKYVKSVRKRGITEQEDTDCLRPLPGFGMDLELFLVKNGFIFELVKLLRARGVELTTASGQPGYEEEVAERVRGRKTEFVRDLIGELRAIGATSARVPAFFADAIQFVVKAAG